MNQVNACKYINQEKDQTHLLSAIAKADHAGGIAVLPRG